jgi:hypothetical protein
MKSQQSQHHVDRLNRLAWLLDNSIRVPGTNYHIGLDPLIGLVPGIGDAAGALLSMVIVSEAARLGLPATILARMGLNVALEVLIGSIPIIGDVFDMTWKANARNARLFERYTTSSKKTITSSKIMIFFIMLIFAFISVLSIYVGFLILRKLWGVLVS